MSRLQELDYITDVVCGVFDVSRNDLMSCRRKEDVVDARTALCHILDYQGASAKTIASWLGISPRTVNWHLTRYNSRMDSNVWFLNNIQWTRDRTMADTFGFAIRIGNNPAAMRPKVRQN